MARFSDLPVCVEMTGSLAAEVTAWAEAEAGWQVITAGGPLVPALALADDVLAGVPTAVVSDGRLEPARVRDALLAGAVDVVAWPAERDRLLALPARLSGAGAAGRPTPVLRVAGSRGGAGTSTVVLAIGGTVAWSGQRALVVGDAGLTALAGLAPWRGPGARAVVALGAQAGDEVAQVARGVPGVDGLSVLGDTAGPPVVDTLLGWPYDLVILDEGTRGPGTADVVVGCADRSLQGLPADAAVLVVEHGPLDRGGVQRCLERAPAGWLPYSARVARAGSAGRVPSSLPGSWVAALRRSLQACAA